MQNLAYLIIKASRILKNSLDKKLTQYNITASQFSVLNQILEKNGSITSAEIAGILESDRPTISGIITRLEQKGLIEKVENPEDKRSVYLKLPKRASDLVYELREISNKLNLEIFADFNENEKKNMKNYLTKITEAAERI